MNSCLLRVSRLIYCLDNQIVIFSEGKHSLVFSVIAGADSPVVPVSNPSGSQRAFRCLGADANTHFGGKTARSQQNQRSGRHCQLALQMLPCMAFNAALSSGAIELGQTCIKRAFLMYA